MFLQSVHTDGDVKLVRTFTAQDHSNIIELCGILQTILCYTLVNRRHITHKHIAFLKFITALFHLSRDAHFVYCLCIMDLTSYQEPACIAGQLTNKAVIIVYIIYKCVLITFIVCLADQSKQCLAVLFLLNVTIIFKLRLQTTITGLCSHCALFDKRHQAINIWKFSALFYRSHYSFTVLQDKLLK